MRLFNLQPCLSLGYSTVVTLTDVRNPCSFWCITVPRLPVKYLFTSSTWSQLEFFLAFPRARSHSWSRPRVRAKRSLKIAFARTTLVTPYFRISGLVHHNLCESPSPSLRLTRTKNYPRCRLHRRLVYCIMFWRDFWISTPQPLRIALPITLAETKINSKVLLCQSILNDDDRACTGNDFLHHSQVSVTGCLPFTWGNRLVDGLCKWKAKFPYWKFPFGVACTIWTTDPTYRKSLGRLWHLQNGGWNRCIQRDHRCFNWRVITSRSFSIMRKMENST